MMLIKIEKDLLHLKVHTASGRFTDLLTEIDMHFHFVSRPDQGNRKSNSPETSFPSFYSRINNYIFHRMRNHCKLSESYYPTMNLNHQNLHFER